ncbi:16S rRNA (cytosine(967)-C(5))-methyltransferase RsmB [Jeotgalibaca caeni]|uniref:16S rRNA (cytosine(967)-C(5))-methyltransferase RsmB n=1 Tax=Jeotgalibaca caeni TaxID=3028623 RepID=UPI00237E19D9|nr:16S rRNA (cytosine(967)-C(5))-methyltransferase RsmB [Jeotgalibaca caeni]MDE1548016.1 16S rRNA (cytosine(967)-C(5))-methyltransferase RsmB [Jeotgalibaca caeni]
MARKKNNKITHSPRYLAMEVLQAIETEGAYSNLLLNATIEKETLSVQDAGLLTELVYGVTQRRLALDYGLSLFIQKPQKMEKWVLNLLRLSVYQMVYLDKIPDHAILYDAVEIAKDKGHAGIVKLVNGILRNVQRKDLKDPATIEKPNERLSVQASVPVWLVDYFTEQNGFEKTEKMLLSLLEKPFIALRIQNPDEIDQIMDDLKEEGVETVKSPLSPVGLRVITGRVTHTAPFREGKITIQDESSQLVALLGGVKEQDHILDACAAPGGKTMHMASFLDEEKGGVVHALDIHEHKINLIEQNATRMNVSNRVRTHLLDAKEVASQFEPASFDVIFVDAPCSGLGLMRRKPEIKYGVQREAIEALHKEQLQILTAVEPLLKQGGRLVYSTCTLARTENQQTVEAFLEQHQNMQLKPVDATLLPNEIVTEKGQIQIYPDDFTTDGFFICVMEKLSSRGEE